MYIKGELTGLNSFKFVFDNNDIIDADSIRIEVLIRNDNINNYIQIDNSPHSLIKSSKWTINNKVVEYINDYHILLSFLNDLTYKSNKYNDNSKYHNNNKEPLLLGTQEDLVFPSIFGTNSIFNLNAINSSYTDIHDITDGMIDMRINKYHLFSIPIFSYIFCNGPNKKKQFLDLSMFSGLELEIELNKYAFFVPCFRAHINNLLGVYNKGDIKFIDKIILYEDYALINKINTFFNIIYNEKLHDNKIETDKENIFQWDKNDNRYIINDDIENEELYNNDDIMMDIEQPKEENKKPIDLNYDVYFNYFYPMFINIKLDNIYLNLLDRFVSYALKLYNWMNNNTYDDNNNIITDIYDNNMIIYNILMKGEYVYNIKQGYININKLLKNKYKICSQDLNKVCSLKNYNIELIERYIIYMFKDSNKILKDDFDDYDIYHKKSYYMLYYYISYIYYNNYNQITGGVNNVNLFNIKKYGYNINFFFNLNMLYYDSTNKTNVDINDIKIINNGKENKLSAFMQYIKEYYNKVGNLERDQVIRINNPINTNDKYLMGSNFELLKKLNDNDQYISLSTGYIYEIKSINKGNIDDGGYLLVVDICSIKKIETNINNLYNYGKKLTDINEYIELYLFKYINIKLNVELYNIIKNIFNITNKNELLLFLNFMFKIMLYYINAVNKQIILDYIKTFIEKKISIKIKKYTDINIISGSDYINLLGKNILYNKSNIERNIINKDWLQSSKEYDEFNNIKKLNKFNISRDYNIYKIGIKYKRIANKIKTSPWKGSSLYYTQLDKRDFNTHLPIKIFFNEPSKNIKNIYQFILSRAYEKYPLCRFSSRYNRKIKNYWIETDFGRYPSEEDFNGANETTADSVNNFLFDRLNKFLDLSKSNLNVFNTAIDTNTQIYIARKTNEEESKLIIFNDNINIMDYFSFGYDKEVQSRALFGFSLPLIKRYLGIEGKSLKNFYICFENGLSFDYQDTFALYQLYTYGEGILEYEFDNEGNIKY